MSIYTVLLIVALSACALVWGLVLIVKLLKGGSSIISAEELTKAFADIGALKATLQSMEGGQRDLSSTLKETQRVADHIKTDYESRVQLFERLRSSIERMEHTISGTKRRGEAGENILHDIFKAFPSNMVTKNFRVAGKEVEFALVLSNDKVVPIDSKWTAQELLIQLAQEEETAQQLQIIHKIENEINKRVTEVTQYIDPSRTVPWAVAAIPDAAFSVCRKAHLEAYKKGVILIPYSLTLPYLLTLFNLYLQYSGSIDLENLNHHIMNIKRQLETMETTLENSVTRAVKMLDNATNEYRQSLGAMRNSLSLLQSSQTPAIKNNEKQ